MYFNIYTIPLISSFFILCILVLHLRRLKTTPGVVCFTLLLLSTAFYSLSYALEISSTDLHAVLIFYKSEYIGISMIPFFFLLFAINYTGKKYWLSTPLIAFFLIVPLITIFLVLTMEYHDLFHKSFYITDQGLFPVAGYEPGIWYWVQNAYTVTCVVFGIGLLFSMLLGTAPAFRKQVTIVMAGSVIPFLTLLLYLAGMKPWGIDPAPFSMTLSGLIIYIGLTRYKLFDFAPMARSLLFDNIPDSVVILDKERRLMDCNHSAMKDLHIKAEDIGNKVSELPAHCFDLLNGRIETSIKSSIETKVNIGGSVSWLAVTSLPLTDNYGNIIGQMLTISNITARKNAEEELIEKNRLLKEATDNANYMAAQAEMANSAKSQFLAVMSHEMRTPLNGIIGFTDLLMETELTKSQMQHMQAVYTSATSLLDLINDVLDFSKIEAGKLELETERTDLVELCEQVADIVRYKAHEKGLELLLNISPDLPRDVVADRLRLKQVLVNLLGNAVKFTETGEIELKVTAFPVTGTELAEFLFSVRDTGIGIAKESQHRIFGLFSQADGSITRRYGGTGLGLTISNKLLEKMGSRLELESEAGKGSVFCFRVRLPAGKEEHTAAPRFSSIKRALVVDDNAASRCILQNLLHFRGINADLAENGEEALHMADGQDYDLFIVDHNMPSMNGLELARIMREKYAIYREGSSFIILHDSSDSTFVHEGYKELGIRSVLTKPVKSTEFLEIIEHIRIPEKEPVTDGIASGQELADVVLHDNYTIMIAEDNEINMSLACTVVLSVLPGSRVIRVLNGKEALLEFESSEPDLIFMDVQMPELSGYDASRAIREVEARIGKPCRRTPIIAFTAGTVKGERERCLEAGMDDYISKPVVASTIRKVLQKWLPDCECDQAGPRGEEFTNGSHFNKEHLLANIGGDLATFNALISLALTAFDRSLMDMREACAENDIPGLKRCAHKLKGSALNIGCNMLAEMASGLEEMSVICEVEAAGVLDEIEDEIFLIKRDIESRC